MFILYKKKGPSSIMKIVYIPISFVADYCKEIVFIKTKYWSMSSGRGQLDLSQTSQTKNVNSFINEHPRNKPLVTQTDLVIVCRWQTGEETLHRSVRPSPQLCQAVLDACDSKSKKEIIFRVHGSVEPMHHAGS